MEENSQNRIVEGEEVKYLTSTTIVSKSVKLIFPLFINLDGHALKKKFFKI